MALGEIMNTKRFFIALIIQSIVYQNVMCGENKVEMLPLKEQSLTENSRRKIHVQSILPAFST